MTFAPTSVFMMGKEGGSSPTTLQEAAPCMRLYVGNLLYKAQADDIQHLFKVNGFADAQIDMSTDPFTGRNPSYCFVDLRTAEDAGKAMAELNGMEVLGRPVKIKPGVAKKSLPAQGSGGHDEPPRRNAYQATEYKPTFDRWTRADAPAHWEGAPKPGHRVYVGGLPRIDSQPAVDIQMQALFDGFQITAVSKIISPHPSKAAQPGNHFYLFVDLSSTEEADRAIEALNGMPAPWGGKLTVSGTHGGGVKVIREQFGGKRGVWDEDGKSVDGMGSL
ncbi:hypothetical protein FIBSPDRAFT_876956 [Athelia psychrophila]|uniref:RRM domain-containing protein n=1 Tax=Athelia psychrophila TaxID=1759441 RepID=A0A167WCX8_9AGAM|nr:hypothetical protein FIBSPDRAFT_876956 [Fibularhizoctonia sp. CBS 109695]